MTGGLAVFRVDATPSIGAGHLIRCMALAEAMAERGWSCALAANPEAAPIADTLGVSMQQRRFLHSPEKKEPSAMAAAWPTGCDLLVVDHYRRDAVFERACRPWANRVMVIDDLANRPHDCAVLLDPTLAREVGHYAGLVPSDCRLLLGSAYALLRGEFAAARPAALRRRSADSPVQTILVSFGSSDPANATELALDAVLTSGVDAEVVVLIGSGAPALKRLEQRARNSAVPVRLEVDCDAAAVSRLIHDADIAIGAPGSGTWERCCLGLPAIMVSIAENQELVAKTVCAAGGARYLGRLGSLTVEDVAVAIRTFVKDAGARKDMARVAAGLCDGLGSALTAATIDPSASRDGLPVTLRPAARADSARIYEWQAHPETRRHFRNQEPPSGDEHTVWLEATIADPDRFLYVIMHGQTPAGAVRLDRDHDADGPVDDAFEVSIYVAPEMHGCGIGSAALSAIRALMPQAQFRADVLPGNAASVALFEGAGYRASGHGYIGRPEKLTIREPANKDESRC